MFSEARSASGLSVSARAKMDKHQTRGVDALELMLEDCRLCVRTDRRDERCICFQLVQARPSEIDDEAIAAGHGAGVDDVAADALLIHGARSVLCHAKVPTIWQREIQARRPANVAAVALANKMARTAWAILAHGQAYQKDYVSVKPA